MRQWLARSALVSAMVLVGAGGVAAAAAPVLHRVNPPDGAYSLLLPPGWLFRDVSYPSDHATNLWWTPSDPLARMIVVLSACVGCVSANGNSPSGIPNPLGAAPGATDVHRLGSRKLTFIGPYEQAEPGYQDNGLVIITGSKRYPIDGYVRVDLWLPGSEKSLAAAILKSFRVQY